MMVYSVDSIGITAAGKSGSLKHECKYLLQKC